VAHFFGTLVGCRGQASRLGSKDSGIDVTARGWNIGGSASVRYNSAKDRDEVDVYVDHGSNGHGLRVFLGTWYRNSKGNLVKVKR
jgi:hypothetical protein